MVPYLSAEGKGWVISAVAAPRCCHAGDVARFMRTAGASLYQRCHAGEIKRKTISDSRRGKHEQTTQKFINKKR